MPIWVLDPPYKGIVPHFDYSHTLPTYSCHHPHPLQAFTPRYPKYAAMFSHLPHTLLHSPPQVFLTPKYLGVVMEYGGMDLGAYLNQEGGTMGGTEKRVSEDVSRLCFQQLILALEFCHRCGKGHRDIKLGNVSAGGWGGGGATEAAHQQGAP